MPISNHAPLAPMVDDSAASDPRMRRYILVLVTVFGAFATVIWLPALLLWRTGEIWPERLAVSYLVRHDAIWSSGLIQNEYAFKREMYDQIQPDVVIIGSSMVLQFRQEMFTARLLNMGRGLDEVIRFREQLDDLTATHRPRVVVWGIDYWVLVDTFRKNGLRAATASNLVRFTPLQGRIVPEVLPTQIFSTWDLIRAGQIRSGKISVKDASIAILKGASLPGPRIGLRAAITDYGGYARDGSFYYFDSYERPSTRYHDMLRRSREYAARGVYGLGDFEQMSEEAVSEVEATIAMLRSRGIDVVLFMPPIPPPMAAVITKQRPDLIAFLGSVNARLSEAALKHQATWHNFLSDPDQAMLTEGDFLDAGHPGEPASAKMLSHLAKLNPGLARAIDRTTVDQIAKEYSGLAVVDRPIYARFGVQRREPWPPRDVFRPKEH